MFVPYGFWSTCIFLNNEFEDSVLFVLNEFFCYDNIDGKRSVIRWISNIRINAVIIDFHGIRMKEKYIYNWIHIVGIVQVWNGDLLDRIRWFKVQIICNLQKRVTIRQMKEIKGSQILFLMLKSPAIIRMFQRFTSVSLRYFKVDWWSSEYILSIKKISPLLKK